MVVTYEIRKDILGAWEVKRFMQSDSRVIVDKVRFAGDCTDVVEAFASAVSYLRGIDEGNGNG